MKIINVFAQLKNQIKEILDAISDENMESFSCCSD